MFVQIVRQFLIFAATVSAVVTAPSAGLFGEDGPLAILLIETVEDAEEEDERKELFEIVSEPIDETILYVATISVSSTFIGIPIVCGPHNERGPPAV